MQEREIWRNVPEYEGIYKVSNMGRVKSLKRKVPFRNGLITVRERILKPSSIEGYLHVIICKEGTRKGKFVHQLVAMAFLGHRACGHELVVDHRDFNRTNNRLDNLVIITNRENTNKRHIESSSKYTGVSWNKNTNKWQSCIAVSGKDEYLGVFGSEYDAHLAYQKKLKEITS